MSTSVNFLSSNCPETFRVDGLSSVPSGLVTENTRSTLVQAIKACLVAADKPNSIRTGLRQIHCESRGSDLFLTSTNGHICLTVEVSIPCMDRWSFSISGDSAKSFVSSKGHSALLPSFDEFPNVRQVVPTSFGPSDLDTDGNTARVGFSGLYLTAIGRILTALKMNRAGLGNGVAMRHNGPLSPVLFESDFVPESDDTASIRGFSLIIMPIRLD